MRSSGYMSSPFGKERPSLGQLLDSFRHRESSRVHDQVYALLGMSGEPDVGAGIRPDYRKPWFEVQKEVFRFIVGSQIKARFESFGSCVIVQTSGYVVGYVLPEKPGESKSEPQNELTIWDGVNYETGYTYSSRDKLGAGLDIQEGDLLCRLSSTEHLIIARPCHSALEVIRICLPLHSHDISAPWSPNHQLYSLRLIWHCGCARHPKDLTIYARLGPVLFDPDPVRLGDDLTHKRRSSIMSEVQVFIGHVRRLEYSYLPTHLDFLDETLDEIIQIINMGQIQDQEHSRTVLRRIMSMAENLVLELYPDLDVAVASRAALQEFSYDIRFDSAGLVNEVIETLQGLITDMMRHPGPQPDRWSFVGWAASAGHQGILRRSLQEIRISSANHLAWNHISEALMEAALQGDSDIIGILLEFCDVICLLTEHAVQKAMNLASFSGYVKASNLLLRRGARINEFVIFDFAILQSSRLVVPITFSENDFTNVYRPLQLAIEGNHLAMAKFLLDNGAQSRTVSSRNAARQPIETPLEAAVRVGNPEMIALLENYIAREEEEDG